MERFDMIEVVRCRDEQSTRRRLWISGSAALLTIISVTVLLTSPSRSDLLLEAKPTVSTSLKQSKLGQLNSASNEKLSATLVKGSGPHPKTVALSEHAKTTKLEWQQGWQPNGWQLRDGDWPDEGSTFSEGQTYADDPATFKVHQTYAYVPGNHPISKAEAEADWVEMQKKYFRRTPSRSTYPAVPVVFDEDDEGGHSHVQPIEHRSDNIYINSEHRPYFPVHRRFFPVHTRHFQSAPTGQELYLKKGTGKVSDKLKSPVGQEYARSQLQNEELEQQLAEVEKESNLAAAVDSAADSTGLSKYIENSPYNYKSDAGELQDWKEVLFMQGALYEMQKKLSEEEDENRKLRDQLAMWKGKGMNVVSSQKTASSPSPQTSEQQEISELQKVIEEIQNKQKSTDLENKHLREQLSAIQKLTIKKAKLDGGSSAKTSTFTLSSIATSSEHRWPESLSAHKQISHPGAVKVPNSGAVTKSSSKIRSHDADASIIAKTLSRLVASERSAHAGQAAAPLASKAVASPEPNGAAVKTAHAAKPAGTAKPVGAAKPAAVSKPAVVAKPAAAKSAPAAAAAVAIHSADTTAQPATVKQVEAAAAKARPLVSVSSGAQAKKAAAATVAASSGTSKQTSATITAKAAAASVVAFRQASLATKDAVVRALAADEESSLDSDTNAIFGSGTAVDEEDDVGRDGFDRLHSLERSALGEASR